MNKPAIFFSCIFISICNFCIGQNALDTAEVHYVDEGTVKVLTIKKGNIHNRQLYYASGNPREFYVYYLDTLRSQVGWYPNGIKMYEYHFVKGKLDGKVWRYYEDGKLKCTQHYLNGLMHGKEIWYSQKNGKIELVRNYKFGNELK